MNYSEFKQQQQETLSEFPMFFAFNKNQFQEGIKKLGVTEQGSLLRIPGGGFIRKTDSSAFRAFLDTQSAEMQKELENRAFLIDALIYELDNHEFSYTFNPEPAFTALGITLENTLHKECFEVAKNIVLQYKVTQ